MKIALVSAALISLCAGSVLPVVPGDNSHYVEGESQYIWMSGRDGEPVLVDLHEPVDEEYLKTRNGAHNAYWLYTRQNPTSAQVLNSGNANSIYASNYLGSRPTKVIVHGWNNNGYSPLNPQITAAFLAAYDCNVIVVDWNGLANQGYTTAANGVPDIGQHLATFLNWLINTAGGSFNNVHLVGHSLGAHVVGNAGRSLGGRAARVTGLDPAGPTWGGNTNALRANDGQYVECIHTDGGLLGIMDAIGAANFYPNGGRNPQPGCTLSTCSHGRAPELFAASVQYNHMMGRQCSNIWEAELSTCSGATFPMGNGNLGKRGSGIFGLLTGSSWPF